MSRFRIAAQPINWINDDFRDLGADCTLERALDEMKEAGFEGTELGHRFPESGAAIRALLQPRGLSLAGAWHSTYLASGPWADDVAAFDKQADRLQSAGASVIILAECTGALHGDGAKPLGKGDQRGQLGPPGQGAWRALCEGLERLAQRAAARGMKTAYHPHMGTVVQTAADVDALMAGTRELGLLLDTGHLAFAGDDPRITLEKHGARVTHVHTKDVRFAVARRARAEGWSFERAVRAGVFTVPGDGDIDFPAILAELNRNGYAGWIVVEAEQDPQLANPLAYAKMGRATLRRLLGA
jgi:myo-inosose-2 dehydratase